MHKARRKNRSSWVANKIRQYKQDHVGAGRSGTSGYVYVMSLGDDLYKIGITGNVEQRRKDLAATNPKIFPVIASRVKDMRKCEDVLHRRYKDKCVEREIFKLGPEALEAIRVYLDQHVPQSAVTVGAFAPRSAD